MRVGSLRASPGGYFDPFPRTTLWTGIENVKGFSVHVVLGAFSASREVYA